MIESFVYKLPQLSNVEMMKRYNLKEVLSNDRTTICQNENMRVSFDKVVTRVLLFNNSNHELIEDLNRFFYGEDYYEDI